MQRRLLILISTVLLAPVLLPAQDMTGVWQGHFREGNVATHFGIDERYKFEVQIAEHDKKFDAVTYSYLSTIFYGKAAAAGTINIHTGKVLLQEGKLLELRNSAGSDACIMTCFLQYSKSGDEEFLEGSYVSMNVRDSSNCGRGTVFLHKVASSDFYEEPFLLKREKELELEKKAPPVVKAPPIHHRPDSTRSIAAAKPPAPTAKPSVPARKPITHRPDSTAIAHVHHAPVHHPAAPATEKQPPAMAHVSIPGVVRQTDSSTSLSHTFATIRPKVLRDRENLLVRNLTLHTNDVVLNIYDDGAIDHDTISVYLDNKQVINHAMLTDRPLVVTLHLDENEDYHELVLVAENEGEIPPNTSLMIVKAGDKEYEVRITSTEQKNAVVTFKYAK